MCTLYKQLASFRKSQPNSKEIERKIDVMELIIREMQMKTTRYYLMPVRMVLIKKSTINKILVKMWRKCNTYKAVMGM